MPQLEKYRGNRSRYTCPVCGRKNQFARYMTGEGDYIDESVGRCNRESSCGYHLTPKEFFASRGVHAFTPEQRTGNEQLSGKNDLNTLNKMNALNADEQTEHFDTIDNSFITRSLTFNQNNRFFLFLSAFIEAGYIFEMAKKYLIGATRDGKTVFWQIDGRGRARTGKIISYDRASGKRDKEINPSWIHYELKKHKLLPPEFRHQICFFGEHLLRLEREKAVGIVEAEKTAAVASIFIDEFVWLAVGGKSYLKADKLRRFGKRKIVLFPDGDGFELWKSEAEEAARGGMRVSVSRLIEDSATPEEKKSGFDLADYLIRSEKKAKERNDFADSYNKKVDKILENDESFSEFNTALEERIAIMESEAAATEPENLRAIVESITG